LANPKAVAILEPNPIRTLDVIHREPIITETKEIIQQMPLKKRQLKKETVRRREQDRDLKKYEQAMAVAPNVSSNAVIVSYHTCH
jgi:hypothetical protein